MLASAVSAALAQNEIKVHRQELVEQKTPPPDPAGPPRRLTNVVTHPDYHPSYMRVGVKVDGEDRNDIHWYDQDAGVYATNARLQPVKSGFIETYWRYPETRQQRRARERWEQSR